MTTESKQLSAQQHLDRGDIPLRFGNRIQWMTQRQLVNRMRDDFESRHTVPVPDEDDDDD